MKYFILLSVFFSGVTFSEIFTARDEYNRLFVMEKLQGPDDMRTKNWCDFAKTSVEFNQRFLAKTKPYTSAIEENLLFEENPDDRDFFPPGYKPVDIDKAYQRTIKSLDLWAEYYRKTGGDNPEKALKILSFHKGVHDGLDNFRNALMYKRWESMEKWVAYVARDGLLLKDSFSSDDTQNIEMVMTVLVPKDGTPMTIHMGISRNFINLMSGEQTPHTATQLHGFAAKVIDSIKPGFTMITTPSGPMTKILQEAGLRQEDISVGKGDGARLKIVSDPWMQDFEFTLLEKGSECQAAFTRTALKNPSFVDFHRVLHVDVSYVAIDLCDLKALFTPTVDAFGCSDS